MVMEAHGGGGGGQQQGHVMARQSSLYSLSLDQVQTHLGDLGKPLKSMNLEELINSVLSAESSLSGVAGAAIDEAVRKRTVDQIWKDVEKGGGRRVGTLGEMTIEDLLARAGAAPAGMGGGYGGAALCAYEDDVHMIGRKRVAPGDVVEKTVERRQKRMIKNRESAARSRARRQNPHRSSCRYDGSYCYDSVRYPVALPECVVVPSEKRRFNDVERVRFGGVKKGKKRSRMWAMVKQLGSNRSSF